MAASTVSLGSTAKTFYRGAQKVRRGFNVPNDNPDGLMLMFDSGAFTPASTSTDDVGDLLEVLQFPYGFHLMDLEIKVTAEVDTGGAGLVYDLTAFDGVSTHVTLISGATIGAGATGNDRLDVGLLGLDVSGLFLTLKITTPATSNAGTGSLRIKGFGFQGDPIAPN
jgi:hypothetical protein